MIAFWRSLSIRQTLLFIIGALTLIIALFALKDIYANWVQLSGIETLKNASELSDRLFDATERLSVERDLALSMLHAPDADAIDNLKPRLLESRQGTEEALRASIVALDEFGFSELSELSAKIGAHLNVIAGLRPDVDAAVALPAARRDDGLPERWAAEVTALMQETDALWTGFVKHFTDVDPVVTQHLSFKHLLRTITDYTGRERSLIGQVLAQDRPATPEEVVELQRGQGVVQESWEMSRTLAGQSRLFPAIAPIFSDATSHYSTMHDMIQSLFYMPDARQGAPYPIGVDLWFELSGEAADSLTSLRAAAITATRGYVDGLIAATEREIAIAGLVFALALVLCAYSFQVVVRRVLDPISRMVEALHKAIRGEPVAATAFAEGDDEIGRLAVVLRAFQRTVDEMRRTTAELARSRTHLSAVVDYAMDGLLTTDVHGVIQNFNPACERIFGYPAEEVAGKSLSMLMPDSQAWDKDAQLPASNAPGAASREVVARRKDGTTFPIDISISTFTLEDGMHYSAIVRDITLRKQVEEELARYTRALERSNKELDDFAYIASHDLKEPLRGIHNHSRFLLEDNAEKLDKDSVGRLNRLTFLSQRMERLVNDLLYFSRLGRQELAVQATDPNAVIRDIETTLDVFLSERKARIEIPKPMPVIICDKPRVAELFRNLITNGIKYNDKPDKVIEIGYLASHGRPDGGAAHNVFYVKDNGRGISPEFHEEIFRIFKRLQSTGEAEEGTGVGLTFVKKIVERHGGRIWLESEPGQGTTFFFTLETDHHDAEHSAKVAA